MTLCDTLGIKTLDQTHWRSSLDQALVIQRSLCDRVKTSRQKDFSNPFMQAVFDSRDEMNAVLGTIEDNGFIQDVCAQTEVYASQVQRFKEQA